MATIVNTPASNTESSSSGATFIIGALILLFVVFMFFYYGLPAMRNAASTSAPSVSVPEQVDVNVNTPEGAQPATE
jgi:hypothetical protein